MKLAGFPSHTVWLTGSVVMTGGIVETTVKVAAALVVLPQPLVTMTS